MKYALKKSGALLWKTEFSKQQVLERFSSPDDYGEWLVCPLGESSKAVEVVDFIADPEMWQDLSKPATISGPSVQFSPGETAILAKLNVIQGWVVFIGIVALIFLGLLLLVFIRWWQAT